MEKKRSVKVYGQSGYKYEKTTPVGYKTSEDVSFIAPTEEPLYKVTFYNVQVPDDVPKTGDGFPKLLIVGLAAIGLVGIGTCIWIKKKL